jgi:hypothetical protein
MPQPAINTGFVDYVLPAEAIASKVEEIMKGRQNPRHNVTAAEA